MNKAKNIISHSPEETGLIGKNYAASLSKKDIVGLFGNLGSGKTQFVKGICEFFKVKDIVNSPTFILANQYKGLDINSNAIFINHLDLYRLKNINELIEIGIESYINEKSICIIEWAQLANMYLNGKLNKIYFDLGTKSNERIIKI